MKKITVLFLLIASLCQAQVRLSEHAEISVVTCGPSIEEVYSAFGHSAFRVYDPVNRIDYVYNYGVFDFDKPNFYLNFARGENLYQLGVYDYRRFEYSYILENRYIHQQLLNLDGEEKQKLFDFLQWNALPENMEYLYDYFYDNCATKIPEVVLEVFGEAVDFDGSYIKTDYTFRELTDFYLRVHPWGDLGIDVGLGLPTDKVATPYEYMFLPEYVESGFAHAKILHDGVNEPLVRETTVIYESKPEDYSFPLFHPLVLFFLFLLLTLFISYRDTRRKRLSMRFDAGLFAFTGITGTLLLLLWLATTHHASAKNFNLLWALPTHVVAVTAFTRHPRWLEKYFLVVAILMTLLVVSWPVLPQKLHYSLIPFVASLGIRAYLQYRLRKPGT